jgi:hypothetical protein
MTTSSSPSSWWRDWCPLVVFEAGNDGHVDVLAAVLTVGAGRFDPREAGRLAGLVELHELQPA